jgi:hypothetical protein
MTRTKEDDAMSDTNEPSPASAGSVAYRELVEDVSFSESGARGELRVSECGTYDDNGNRGCVDLNFLWINACCDTTNEPGDEVRLSREQVAKLAASLARWVETGVLTGAGTDAD